MRWLALGLLAACGGARAPAPEPTLSSTTPARQAGPDLAAELATVEDLERDACGCRDLACLDAVDLRYAAYVDAATVDWPAALALDRDDTLAAINECFSALEAVPQHAREHGAVRTLERHGERACACADDGCLRDTLAAFRTYDDWATIAMAGQDATLAQRVLGARNSIARCLAPVVQDLVEDALATIGPLRDRACACPDRACGVAAAQELFGWLAADMTRGVLTIPDPRVEQLLAAMKACAAALP